MSDWESRVTWAPGGLSAFWAWGLEYGEPEDQRDVAEAIEAGCLIALGGARTFDLAVYRSVLPSLRGLTCTDGAQLAHVELLSDATNLEVLYAGNVSSDRRAVDLAQLPRLRQVSVTGIFESALRNPSLRNARFSGTELPQVDAVGLEFLSASVDQVQGLTMIDAPNLRELVLDCTGTVDLSGIEHLRSLESLRIDGARQVVGALALEDLRTLSSVELLGIRSLDHVDVLGRLNLTNLVLNPNSVMADDFADTLRNRPGRWDIGARRLDAEHVQRLLPIEPAAEGYAMSTNQFAWFTARLREVDEERRADGYLLESVLRSSITQTLADQLAFDSESGLFSVTASEREVLEEARSNAVNAWKTNRALRRALSNPLSG